jgi:hypothetical protein
MDRKLGKHRAVVMASMKGIKMDNLKVLETAAVKDLQEVDSMVCRKEMKSAVWMVAWMVA